MTGDLDAGARRALIASEGPTLAKQQGKYPVDKQRAGQEQKADQEQPEDAALEVEVPRNPFDRKDFVLFIIPVAVIVFAMWEGASL